jgi:putative endonuclease
VAVTPRREGSKQSLTFSPRTTRYSNNYYTYTIDNQYFVYIMTNKFNTVLYTGITNNLIRRVYEHKEGLIKGFTSRYNVDKLVYYEVFEDITEAISREKQIKGGSRQRKIDLVDLFNGEWKDLYEEISG